MGEIADGRSRFAFVVSYIVVLLPCVQCGITGGERVLIAAERSTLPGVILLSPEDFVEVVFLCAGSRLGAAKHKPLRQRSSCHVLR